MAYSDPGTVTGGLTPARATWANTVRGDLVDHEARIAAVESGGLIVLSADPASPADDTFWMVKEAVSPGELVSLRVRISGVTYTVAAITVS
jgi:hypothetical protein